MSCMNAIDTNVLVYSIDPLESTKRVRAKQFLMSLDRTAVIVPWQVYCEFGSVDGKLMRAGRATTDAWATVTLLPARYDLALPTLEGGRIAHRLQQDSQVSYGDAFLVAAYVQAGANRLYTEDLQTRPSIAGVEIVNPFV